MYIYTPLKKLRIYQLFLLTLNAKDDFLIHLWAVTHVLLEAGVALDVAAWQHTGKAILAVHLHLAHLALC